MAFVSEVEKERIKASVDLQEWAGRYTELRKHTNKELKGPCPKCSSSDDGFHVHVDGWFKCYTCHQKRGDALEFVQWIGAANSFPDALKLLNGGTLPTVAGDVAQPVKVKREKRERTPEQIARWRAGAAQEAERAAVRLWEDAGRVGLEFLRGRGFTDDSLRAYGIGYEPNANGHGPSISIPWVDRDGSIPVVRYRHINKGNYSKYTCKVGSDIAGYMHGLAHLRGRDALVLVEGELNALSIIQATRGAVDVLSSGSESFTVTDEMAALIGSYAVRLVWMDKERIAVDTMAKIPGAYGFPSVGGYDANDWLKDGRLGELVRGLLEKAGAKVEPHAGPVVVGGFTIPGRVLGWFDTFSDAWGVASATGASIIREGLGVGKFLVWE